MVAKMKERRRGGATTEERLETVLRGLCESRGNRATVYVDELKTAQTIALQTRQMRRWFKAFPEVMLIDATHNTNESRHKLFSFMVNDVYGNGQYVHHSLMENESAECLSDAIGSFKFNNPSWEQVRVIVIDKDMGELGLLEEEFPGVKVIMCHEVIIRRISLRGGRETSFGSVPYNGLLTLRENVWMDDTCMGHGISLLQREHPNIGVANPIFNRSHDRDSRHRAIHAGKPFKKTNQIILLPLHIDDNHWCGAVFDYRSERRRILVCDPLQDPKSKYYVKCEVLLKDKFLENEDGSPPLPIQRVTNARQPNFSSCGAAVLLFFECYLTGIEMPEKPSHASMRFYRLRYMLKCLQ